jgi:uncharacterized membrane protein YraQ (UPF0718 family)
MSAKGRKARMIIPTVVMMVLAIILLYLAYHRGNGEHILGLKAAGAMTIEVLPLLIFAFIVAGLMQELMPHELLSRWVGEESGFRGIMLGSLAGGLAPGGPFVSLPIAAGLVRSGAGIGTMVAFLTGWSLWAFSRLPMEVGILGWRLTLIRVASTVVFPPLAGFVAHVLFGGTK